ncbi:hypothetical protein HPB48_005408 [Haemaphysalis longicornis]|uniref:Alpha-carbonic anhydrase domain-containing protein n=1 Tax=Haemaphysalis longicornis TaxID=44386 RepID=A0A9J6GG55_HAELO|nr:hypothetical protein HPB48_005408 [Haemaphysalis longicornis]
MLRSPFGSVYTYTLRLRCSQLYLLRKLMQGDELNAKAPLSDNFRPTLPVNQRLVRTNIDFKWKQVGASSAVSPLESLELGALSAILRLFKRAN